MVGSKGSGNKRPTNRIPIFATTEMLDFLRSLPNKKGVPFRNLIMRDFLERHKDAFIAMHGEESYKEHMEKYNLNTTEMQLNKLARDKEANKKREEDLRLKRKDLDLKEREIALQEKRLENRNDKKNEIEEENLREELGVLNDDIKGLESLRGVRSLKDKEKEDLQTKTIRRDEIKMRLEELEGNET